jgi:hypothetical protein
MKLKSFIILSAIIFALSSCYREIDMEDYRPEPTLVLNSAISTDTVVMAGMARTRFFTDTGRYEVIGDADVSLHVNGVFMERMPWQDNADFYGGGIYRSAYRPVTGDVICLSAQTRYGEVRAEETVPAKVAIERVEISRRTFTDHTSWRIDENGNIVEMENIEITYKITFQDDADAENYYFVRIEHEDPARSIGNLDYSSDPVFVEQASVVEGLFTGKEITGQGGRAFSDKMINGQRHTSVVTETDILDLHRMTGRRISLYAIPASYYHYLASLQAAGDAANMVHLSTFGLAEPVRVYSNVQGGTGIMAVSQRDMIVVDTGK